MAIDLKKPVGKSAKPTYTTKKGINLARDEEAAASLKRTVILGGIVLIAGVCLLKFGVVDQNAKLLEAQSNYYSIQDQNTAMSQAIADYGAVQVEYRTYATEWNTSDSQSVDYVSVPRTKLLDLIETQIMPRGNVKNISISGDRAVLSMDGMTLEDASEMINDLRESPYIAAASLNNAATYEEKKEATPVVEEEEEPMEGEEGEEATEGEEMEAAPVETAETEDLTAEGSLISFTLTLSLQADESAEEVTEG